MTKRLILIGAFAAFFFPLFIQNVNAEGDPGAAKLPGETPRSLVLVAQMKHSTNHGMAMKKVSVDGAYARASIGQAKNGAAYMMLHNSGSKADRLIAVKSDVAKKVELHTHLNENGVMKMRPIEAIELPAGGMAALKPGGDHVMLMGLKAPLKDGESFPLILIFEHAGEIEARVSIGKAGAAKKHGDHSGHSTN